MNELEIRPSEKTRKMVIVEDDTVLAEIARSVSIQEGCTPTIFYTAESACAQMQTMQEADIILLDVHLPKKDGEWLCWEIRNNKAESLEATPWIIAHTTDLRPEKIEALLRAGANDHLAKPINPQRLALKIKVATYNIARTRALKIRIENLQKMVIDASKPPA